MSWPGLISASGQPDTRFEVAPREAYEMFRMQPLKCDSRLLLTNVWKLIRYSLWKVQLKSFINRISVSLNSSLYPSEQILMSASEQSNPWLIDALWEAYELLEMQSMESASRLWLVKCIWRMHPLESASGLCSIWKVPLKSFSINISVPLK